MIKQKQGISLIVLIITIIVVIILAAAVILNLNNNNPISNAKEAAFKEDVRGFQDELSMSISKEYTDNQGQRDVKISASDYNTIKNYIPSFTEKYASIFEISDDELVYIGNEKSKEFEWCKNINIKTETAADWDSDIDYMDAFESDPNDESILIGIDGTKLSGISVMKIPSKYKKIKISIVTQAFNTRVVNDSGITQVKLPDGLEEIGDNAFDGFTSLTTINIPDSVTSIGKYAFMLCNKLTNILISNNNNLEYIKALSYINSTVWYKNLPDGEVYFGKVFYSYKGDMPENCTLNIKDGTKYICNSALYSNENLNAVIIPDSVTGIGNYNFSDCSNLSNITMSKNVIKIGTNVFKNTAWYNSQNDGFIYLENALIGYKGTNLDNSTIKIKDGVKCIASGCFSKNNTDIASSIQSVEIPNSVVGIGIDAFYGCSNLSSLSMSQNVKYIGEAAFAECTSLNEIFILSNVDEVERRIFGNWSNSQTINFKDSEDVTSTWEKGWDQDCNANLHWLYTGE